MTVWQTLRTGLAAGAAFCLAQPAFAQIEGEWAISIDGRPVDPVYLRLDRRSEIPLYRLKFGATLDPVVFTTPKLAAALYTDDGLLLSRPEVRLRAQFNLDGTSDGLAWSGWWYIADGVAQPRSLDITYSNDCGANFGLYPSGANMAYARPHRKVGQFNILFNAAENEFTGKLVNNCRQMVLGQIDQHSRPITGRRIGPTATPRLRPTAPALAIARLPRVMRSFGADGGPTTLMIHLNDGGRTKALELSKHYRISPNSSDALAGDRFDLDVLVDQQRRPARLKFLAVEFTGPPIVDSAKGTTILRGRLTGRSFLMGIPFVGVPRPGTSITGMTYNGAFCGAFAWIPVVEFGDNGRNERNALRPEAERTTMLWPVSSSCGARTHPEQVPAWAVRG